MKLLNFEQIPEGSKLLRATGQNVHYGGVNCALLGPSKSIHYSGDFVIAGFVSTYFTVNLQGSQMLFVLVQGSSL